MHDFLAVADEGFVRAQGRRETEAGLNATRNQEKAPGDLSAAHGLHAMKTRRPKIEFSSLMGLAKGPLKLWAI